MRFRLVCTLTAVVLTSTALLSACTRAGDPIAQSTLPSFGADVQGSVTPGTEERDLGKSWMRPDATSADLVYASDNNTGDVYVYSFPDGTLVGTLTGFAYPTGLCADKKGDVWIVDSGGHTNDKPNLTEFAHGGTKPIATLVLFPETSAGCAVDPMTGNLAVTDFTATTGAVEEGDVAIFTHASGSPKRYTSYTAQIWGAFCGYDNAGNLFVDFHTWVTGINFGFGELPKGGSSIKVIPLHGGKILWPGAVQWDGKYVTITDPYMASTDGTTVTKMYRTTGASGKIIGSVTLQNTNIYEPWIHQFATFGHVVVVPDAARRELQFANYPAGQVIREFSTHRLYGVTISLATSSQRADIIPALPPIR